MEIPNNFPPWPNVDAAGVDSATAPTPISTSAMPTPAPPSTSAMSPELPSASAMPTPAPPTTFAMPTPAPMSTSPRATIPAAGKSHKKPGHEAQRPGSKKSKKIATQFVEQDAAGDGHAIAPAPPSASAMPTELPSTSAMTSGKSHKRPGSKKSKASPMIMTRSPVVNILARSAVLKRASSAVRHASAKKAKSTHPLESPSQLTTRQNTPSLQDLSPAAGTTSSHGWMRRRRKLVSRIWDEVEPIYDGKILVEGRCIHCRQVFPATRDTGSSHIGRHLKVCPMKIAMSDMVDKLGPPEGADPNWKFDPGVSRRALVKLIAVNEMPFSLVEYKPFREFVASLNPWFKMISRTTARSDCMENFKIHSLKLKKYFNDSSSRVSLTADMWTSNQTLGYLCITCHLIDNDWELKKWVIRFFMMETPHNAINIYNVVLKAIQDWNLEDKLCGFTLDNAPVNTKMVDYLRDNLVDKHLLQSKGTLFHFRCAAHVFNIIVQDGLLTMKSMVNNIRESVKYVKSSQDRGQKFQQIINQVGCCFDKQPTVDVPTRWNSTYLMLESAIPFRSAFNSLVQQDKNYTYGPSADEWKMAESACKLLKVFYTTTNLLSGSNYPTSHLYFPQLWNIKKILKKGASSENETIVYMVEQMEIKFMIYWKESFKQICVPVIFDPRFKFDLLEYLLKDFGSETEADTWMHEVKKAMQKLFDEYSLEILIHHQQEDHVSPDEQELEEEEDPLAEFDHYISRKKVQSNNELDRYLNEELYPRKKDLDILQWWKFNSSKYPVLSRMARDILAIPASTVPSESAFSSGGRIVSDYRCSLSCSTVEALICLQDWLRAADIEGNKGASVEREEADLEPQLDLMKQASTSEQRMS